MIIPDIPVSMETLVPDGHWQQEEKVILSPEVQKSLEEALQRAAELINTIAPDFIVTMGGSGILARILLQQTAHGQHQARLVRFDSSLNSLLYKWDIDHPVSIERKGELIEAKLIEAFSGPLPVTSRILILEDFVRTGRKQLLVLARMRKLGFQDVHFVSVVSQRKSEPDDYFIDYHVAITKLNSVADLRFLTEPDFRSTLKELLSKTYAASTDTRLFDAMSLLSVFYKNIQKKLYPTPEQKRTSLVKEYPQKYRAILLRAVRSLRVKSTR